MTSNPPPSCHDCGVPPGTEHEDGCDVARCLATGYQRLSCTSRHNHGRDVWTGEWPGIADCRRLGWYARLTEDGWEQCGKDDEGAHEDLNRLNGWHARWDRESRRWEALSEQ